MITAVWAWLVALFTGTWHVAMVIIASPAFWATAATALTVAAVVLIRRRRTC